MDLSVYDKLTPALRELSRIFATTYEGLDARQLGVAVVVTKGAVRESLGPDLGTLLMLATLELMGYPDVDDEGDLDPAGEEVVAAAIDRAFATMRAGTRMLN